MGPEYLPHRRTIRLRDYDYSNAGAYFVTICTFDKTEVLGFISKSEMILSKMGITASDIWGSIPTRFPGVELDEYIIMPNRVHGIIVLPDSEMKMPRAIPAKPSLGKIIAYFKYVSTKCINRDRNQAGCRIWQRNYYGM
jgi:putative transposase